MKGKDIVIGGVLGIVCAVVWFLASLVSTGERAIGVIENIYGIPYATTPEGIIVEETLAHADVYLHEPVLAKALVLDVTFDPKQVRNLSVGVRENEFWLSYPKHVVYDAHEGTEGIQQKRVIIPLTDKLQDRDRSIDVMFFTDSKVHEQAVEDTSSWLLRDIDAQVVYDMPTLASLKDYIKSIVYSERPL